MIQLESKLAFANGDKIVFKNGVETQISLETDSSANLATNELILASDLPNLIVYLTDPNQINHRFMTELLLTHRLFIDSRVLLKELLGRLSLCLDCALFAPEQFERNYSSLHNVKDNANQGETRFNSVKKILLRTSVVIRTWLLNYFVDDWLENSELQGIMISYLNILSKKFQNHDKHKMTDIFFLKIILELKRLWLNVCSKYQGSKNLTMILLENGFRSFGILERSVVQFVLNLKITNNEAYSSSRYSVITDIDPFNRNHSIVESARITENLKQRGEPAKRLKSKKSFANHFEQPKKFTKNLAVIHCSNSLASLNIGDDKLQNIEAGPLDAKINRLTSTNLLKNLANYGSLKPSERHQQISYPPTSYNCTIVNPNSSINMLDFKVYDSSNQGYSKKLNFDLKDSSVNVVTKHTVVTHHFQPKPNAKDRLKMLLKDKRVSTVVGSLVTVDDEYSEESKVDYLSSLIAEELAILSQASDAHMELADNSNEFDHTPSGILDVTYEDIDSQRFSVDLRKINRISRSTMISAKSYVTYNSELESSESSLVIFNQSNLKPKVLEKVKSYEKLSQRTLHRTMKAGRLHAENNKENSTIKSAIEYFQEIPVNVTVDSKSVPGTRKTSNNPCSIFSDLGTENTDISSNGSFDVQQGDTTTKYEFKQIETIDESRLELNSEYDDVLASTTANSEVLIDEIMNMSSFVDDTIGDITGYLPNQNIEEIDCSPLISPVILNSTNSNFSKESSISMLSVASYCLPGMDQEIIRRLAQIPDKTFDGVNPISATLLNLEGHELAESPKRKTAHYKPVMKRSKASVNIKDRKVFVLNKSKSSLKADASMKKYDEIEMSMEEQVKQLNINGDIDETEEREETKPNFYQGNGARNGYVFNNVPFSIQDILSKGDEKVVDEYKTKLDSIDIESYLNNDHAAFVLEYESLELAKVFTLIERDIALEIDWKDLVEFDKDFVSNKDHFYRSWVEILIYQVNHKGITLYLNRFNLMINWIISEILMTRDAYLRAQVIAKFIDIGMKCVGLQNYSTLLQIVLSLCSLKISQLKDTWAQLDSISVQSFGILKNFNVDNIDNIRNLHDTAFVSRGTIPFVGLHIHDLKLQLIQPNEIILGNDKLINWSKFHEIANIITETISRIQCSKFYDNLMPEKKDEAFDRLMAKCLYIRALNERQMDKCFRMISGLSG